MMPPQVPLSNLVQIVGGGTPSRSRPEFWNGPIPWASVKDLNAQILDATQETITEAGLSASASSLIEPGAVVIATRMGLGKVAINTVPVAINQDLKALRCSKAIDARYLLRFFQLNAHHLGSLGKGATVKGIRLEVLQALRVPLPPLPDQHRIAAILDRVDALRRKRQETIRLTDELLRSAFLEMFGDPARNPRGWQIRRLEDLATVDRGRFTPRPRNDPSYYGGDLPFIQTGDLSGCSGILTTWRQTLNERGASVSRCFPRGTVAIAIAANIGDTAILGFDSFFPDSVVGIQVKEGAARAEFIEMLLRFKQASLRHHAPETAQKNINLQTLRPLRVPSPPVEAQARFGEVYQKVYRERVRSENSAEELDRLSSSLLHHAFRGEL